MLERNHTNAPSWLKRVLDPIWYLRAFPLKEKERFIIACVRTDLHQDYLESRAHKIGVDANWSWWLRSWRESFSLFRMWRLHERVLKVAPTWLTAIPQKLFSGFRMACSLVLKPWKLPRLIRLLRDRAGRAAQLSNSKFHQLTLPMPNWWHIQLEMCKRGEWETIWEQRDLFPIGSLPSPGREAVYTRLGIAAFKTGRFESAKKVYETGLKDCEDAFVERVLRINYANILSFQGDTVFARKLMWQVLDLNWTQSSDSPVPAFDHHIMGLIIAMRNRDTDECTRVAELLVTRHPAVLIPDSQEGQAMISTPELAPFRAIALFGELFPNLIQSALATLETEEPAPSSSQLRSEGAS